MIKENKPLYFKTADVIVIYKGVWIELDWSLKTAFGSVKDFVGDVGNAIGDTVNDIGKAVSNSKIGQAAGNLIDAGKNFVSSINPKEMVKGIFQGFDKGLAAINSAIGTVGKFVSDMFKGIDNLTTKLMQLLGLEDLYLFIKDVIRGIVTAGADFAKYMIQGFIHVLFVNAHKALRGFDAMREDFLRSHGYEGEIFSLYDLYQKHGILFFGFVYDEEAKNFYTSQYAAQRLGGYTPYYDIASKRLGMDIAAQRIEFMFEGNYYLVEQWKGQYYLSTGCELGIYKKTPEQAANAKDPNFYYCLSDEELHGMFKPSYVNLSKDGRTIVEKTAEHWWLCLFKPAEVSKPVELELDSALTFSDPRMAEAFYKELGINKTASKVNRKGNTVSWTWAAGEDATLDIMKDTAEYIRGTAVANTDELRNTEDIEKLIDAQRDATAEQVVEMFPDMLDTVTKGAADYGGQINAELDFYNGMGDEAYNYYMDQLKKEAEAYKAQAEQALNPYTGKLEEVNTWLEKEISSLFR